MTVHNSTYIKSIIEESKKELSATKYLNQKIKIFLEKEKLKFLVANILFLELFTFSYIDYLESLY